MVQFIRPVKSKKISDTFADHKARGSVNPGVDYVVPVGTPVFAIADGVIDDVTTSVAGAGGRMVWLNCDGWKVDYLHLSKVSVKKGQKVKQGDVLGLSGGSGLGKELGYGPHLHIALRKGGSHVNGKGNRDLYKILKIQAAEREAAAAATAEAPTELPG
jgi:murein DD-endopeptidase